MFRILAVIAFLAFLVAIVLFVVVAIGSPTNGPTLNEWGLAAVAGGLACFALEGLVPVGRPPAP